MLVSKLSLASNMRAKILLTHPCSPQLHDIHVLTSFNFIKLTSKKNTPNLYLVPRPRPKIRPGDEATQSNLRHHTSMTSLICSRKERYQLLLSDGERSVDAKVTGKKRYGYESRPIWEQIIVSCKLHPDLCFP